MRGALQYLPPVVLHDELRQSLVSTAVMSGEDLDRTLAQLVAMGHLLEPEEGIFVCTLSDEELDAAIAAEPVAEKEMAA